MKNKQDEKQEKNNNLIRMVRLDNIKPKTADVHPDMVEDYKKGGWIIQEKDAVE
jgi:hypothetical protein